MATFTPIPGTAQPAPPGPNVGDYLAMFGTGILGGQQQKQGLEREAAEAEKKRQATLLNTLIQMKAQPGSVPGQAPLATIDGTPWIPNQTVNAGDALKTLELKDELALRERYPDPEIRTHYANFQAIERRKKDVTPFGRLIQKQMLDQGMSLQPTTFDEYLKEKGITLNNTKPASSDDISPPAVGKSSPSGSTLISEDEVFKGIL